MRNQKINSKIIDLWDKLDKRKAKLFLVFSALAALAFFTAKYFSVDLNSLGVAFLIVMLSLLALVTWAMAGMAVFRSLFLVGASLTLIIFLAQTYCDLPPTSHTADEALKSLFGFGVLYIAATFVRTLYKELDKSLKHIETVYDGKKPWMIVVPFALFVGLFVWQLSQVMYPIVANLCIYQ